MSTHDTASGSSSNPPDWDAGLSKRLRGLSSDAADVPAETVDRLYKGTRERCDAEDATWAGRLRSRSTRVRRAILGVVLVFLTFIAIRFFPMVEPVQRGVAWWITLGMHIGLIGICLWAVTRPLHIPALSPRAVGGVVFLILGACVGTAFIPSMPSVAAVGHAFGQCMGLGLLLGLPVYGLVRLFDRGNTFGALMAAAAAGLAGSFMLEAHCPVNTTFHVLAEHASVAFVFVVGLLVIHRLTPAN